MQATTDGLHWTRVGVGLWRRIAASGWCVTGDEQLPCGPSPELDQSRGTVTPL